MHSHYLSGPFIFVGLWGLPTRSSDSSACRRSTLFYGLGHLLLNSICPCICPPLLPSGGTAIGVPTSLPQSIFTVPCSSMKGPPSHPALNLLLPPVSAIAPTQPRNHVTLPLPFLFTFPWWTALLPDNGGGPSSPSYYVAGYSSAGLEGGGTSSFRQRDYHPPYSMLGGGSFSCSFLILRLTLWAVPPHHITFPPSVFYFLPLFTVRQHVPTLGKCSKTNLSRGSGNSFCFFLLSQKIFLWSVRSTLFTVPYS